MKIMQVIPYLCFGGAETMCENLTYALLAQGHEVSVVSLYNTRTPISQRMEEAGIRVIYLDKKLGLDVSMVPKLTRIMKAEKPDAVHTHLDVIKYAVAAAKLAGIKRCVHTIHTVAKQDAEGYLQKLVNGFYFRHGWSVPVALSLEIQKTICEFYRMDEQCVPVVFNGIYLDKYTAKTDYSLGAEPILLHIGRFDTPKNHSGLLRAFARLLQEHPNCRLELVGDGDLRPELEEQIRKLGISSRVVLHGMQSNVVPFLQKADVFVLPSVYEGMPMTIIEAMGTGLPIVASDVGGIPTMVNHGESALLVPASDEAVADACNTLLRDESLRRKLGNAAQQQSVRFSAKKMASGYCELYRENR